MRRSTLGLVAVGTLVLLGVPSAVAGVPVEGFAMFSTATTQTIFNGGVRTLYDANVYASPLFDEGNPIPVEQALENFLPRLAGLDALQNMAPAAFGIVFSTERDVTVDNAGEPMQLFQNVAYYFDTDLGLISRYEPLAGLEIGSLDALAAMPDGVVADTAPFVVDEILDEEDPFDGEPVAWAFSTANLEFVIQDDALFPLYPGTIYCYNRLLDRIFVLASPNVDDVDALDAFVARPRSPGEDVPLIEIVGEGDSDPLISFGDDVLPAPVAPLIAFSTGRNEFVASDLGLIRLFQNDLYALFPGAPGMTNAVELFDGNARRIRDLDGFSMPLPDQPPDRPLGVCLGPDVEACVTSAECDALGGDEWYPTDICLGNCYSYPTTLIAECITEADCWSISGAWEWEFKIDCYL